MRFTHLLIRLGTSFAQVASLHKWLTEKLTGWSGRADLVVMFALLKAGADAQLHS